MNKKYIALIISIIISLSNFSSGQSKNASKIIDEINKKFEHVNDYSVDARIKVNVDFLKVPERNVKIYFRKPDKVKMEADGFALLPKQGMNFSPSNFLTDKYESIYVRSEKIGAKIYDVIKVIPMSDTANILLSTLWIDSKALLIKKVNTVTKKSGMIEIEMKYDKSNAKFSLPSEVQFNFNPQDEVSEVETKNKTKNAKPNSRNMKGSVIVYYSNYKVNSGIPESVFTKINQ